MPPDAQDDFARVISSSLRRYAQLTEIKPHIGGSDYTLQLDAIINAFPTFIFLLSNQIGENEAYYEYAKDLRIIGIASNITKHPAQQSHIRLFLEHIDSNDDLRTLTEKASEQNADTSYFPKVLQKDFQLFRRNYKDLKPTQNIHELIELLFTFQGLLQLFLKYYFGLLRQAQTDAIAVHIDRIFNGMFAALRLQEIRYWNNYRDSSRVQNELIQTIRLDIHRKRHPALRKQIFESLKNWHPIIKDARTHYSDPNVRASLSAQVDDFVAFSTVRQSLFLGTVQKVKGRSNVIYLLTQLLSRQNKKLLQLQNYLNQLEDKANQDILQLVNHLVGKMSSTSKKENVQSAKQASVGVVLQTAESVRRSEAQKRLKEREKARAMSIDQVSKLMDKRLNKLNTHVKSIGIATQGTVSENLVRFNQSAKPLMDKVSIKVQPQLVEKFKTESTDMLQDLASNGRLTSGEVNHYKTQVDEISLQLNHTDPTRRAEAINRIGITISDASIKSEKRKGKAGDQQSQGSPAETVPKKPLSGGQVSSFLKGQLTTLYEHVKTDGALTDNQVSNHLSQYTAAAQEIMIEVPVEKQSDALNQFKVSTGRIIDDIVEKGFLPKEKIEIYVNDIEANLQNLKSANDTQRSELISQIGITLNEASQASEKAQGTAFDTRITAAFDNLPSVKQSPKAMTQDQVTQYLKDYLKKLYERVRIEGALTQDKIAEYLAQFADVSQEIVVDIPVERRREVVEDFKVATNIILKTIYDEGKMPEAEVTRYKAEINEKLDQLDTPDLDIRIEVVGEIGDKLAEASIQSVQEEVLDETFLKKAIIPYGFDEYATRISTRDFFTFPFGERKGPPEDDWFVHHVRYLNLAAEKKKLEEAIVDKITKAAPKLPIVKYKKYFNIFPGDQLEETTFLAVLDLWQNKALDKLRA